MDYSYNLCYKNWTSRDTARDKYLIIYSKDKPITEKDLSLLCDEFGGINFISNPRDRIVYWLEKKGYQIRNDDECNHREVNLKYNKATRKSFFGDGF